MAISMPRVSLSERSALTFALPCRAAAQKTRDDFDEAERALREVDDQIK